MIARCLVGVCLRAGVSWESESRVELELLAEAHRREAHVWVGPGKCHRIDEAVELAAGS